MEGRIIYTPVRVGEDSPETRPQPEVRENGRVYRMPEPGKCFAWPTGGTETIVLEEIPKDAAYSLLIVNDFEEALPDPDQSLPGGGVGQKRQLHDGVTRARDLADAWRTRGVILIAGKLPTAQEIERAQEHRLAEARKQTQINEHRYRRGSVGQKDGITSYNSAEKGWAKEAGVELPDTLATLQKVEEDPAMKACPFCAEQIQGVAVKCRFCGERLDKPDTVPSQAAFAAAHESTGKIPVQFGGKR